MKQLISKEFKLCLHPVSIAMLATPFMVMLPGFPYLIVFFYMTFGIFMISQRVRENNDVIYSLTLPIKRSDLVKSKVIFFSILELIQLAITAIFVLVSHGKTSATALDPNMALLGYGFIFFGIFNLIYFSLWFRNMQKVGKSYFIAALVSAVLVVADPISTHMVPFITNVIDTPDPQNMLPKLMVIIGGILVYLIFTILGMKLGTKKFEKQDIR